MLVTLSPGGKMESFEVSADPHCSLYQAVVDVKFKFTPLDNTQSSLEIQGDPLLRLVGDNIEILSEDVPYNPNFYLLTTREGYKYYIDQSLGLQKVIEPNGSSLTFSDAGILHSHRLYVFLFLLQQQIS